MDCLSDFQHKMSFPAKYSDIWYVHTCISLYVIFNKLINNNVIINGSDIF